MFVDHSFVRLIAQAWEWGHMNSQNKVFTDAVEDLKDAMAAHDKINPGKTPAASIVYEFGAFVLTDGT